MSQATTATEIVAGTWAIDPVHSDVSFTVRHLMSKVRGSFTEFSGEITTTDNPLESTVSVTIASASITTNNEQRDAHLRNSDFFEVEKYPKLRFRSTKIEKVDDESFQLFGDLTLKGVTNPVKLDVEFNGVTKDPWGGERAGFFITGKIKRSDFGISFNAALETGGVVLGEEVKLNSEIQLVKQEVAVAP